MGDASRDEEMKRSDGMESARRTGVRQSSYR